MSRRTRTLAYLVPVVLAGLLLLSGWIWLGRYTRHDVSVAVPDLAGLRVEEAVAALEQRDLVAEVIDSVYIDQKRMGTVVLQDPAASHAVKPGRKIYLTMNARQPKMLNMPALVSRSKRQAISTLEIVGLKIQEMKYRPDPCLDCVLEQLYKGRPIAADERIRRGEAVTLVLGSGESGERVQVPDLRGLTFAELKEVLNMASLNLGLVVDIAGCDDNTGCDTALARVVRQSPEAYRNNLIGVGAQVDVWLTADTTAVLMKAKGAQMNQDEDANLPE